MQSDQRELLLAAKLAGLIRSYGAVEDFDGATPEVRGALTVATSDGSGFCLIERGEPGAVASAVLWAKRTDCHQITVFVDENASTGARFASYFAGAGISIAVRRTEGASSVAAAPDDVPAATPAPAVPEGLLDALRHENLEIVIEHGAVRGEVLGLEVARLVRWPAENGGDDEFHLEAGVGRFDRDAVAAVHADISPADSLARTVEMVREHRYHGAPVHPLQLLNRERWLRASLVAEPGRVGASKLRAVEMTTEAAGMRDPHPAAALGERSDGRPVLVVCSTGIDMAVVPLAADLRGAIDQETPLVIAVPQRDRHRATVELAAMLDGEVDVVGVEAEWG